MSESHRGRSAGFKLGLWVGGLVAILAIVCVALASAHHHLLGDASAASTSAPSATPLGSTGVLPVQRAPGVPRAAIAGSEPSAQAAREVVPPDRQLRDAAGDLELHDRADTAGLEGLKNCEDPECEIARLAYKAGGDVMAQARRAEVAPDAVARECEAGKVNACEALRTAYSGKPSRFVAYPARASAFGAKATQLLEQQCQEGDRDACTRLIQNLLYSSPTDVTRGRRLADDACGQGSYGACWMLGEFLARPGPDQDVASATSYFSRGVTIATPRCDAGENAAWELLAEAYRFGRGVASDRKKYVEYRDKVAEAATPH